jgi:putative hydrolase of the HAD superfamily
MASPIVLTSSLGSGYGKPHPRAYRYVEQCTPADIYVYIADNPEKDFEAPAHLGWKTVRVRRRSGLHYEKESVASIPDYEIIDCTALPGILKNLMECR